MSNNVTPIEYVYHLHNTKRIEIYFNNNEKILKKFTGFYKVFHIFKLISYFLNNSFNSIK